MTGDRIELTGEQEVAVEKRRGSLLLAAGAGSGKTSVLVERVAGAVELDGLSPAKILVITFTERAASELEGRLRGRLRGLVRRGPPDPQGGDWPSIPDPPSQMPQVGTFHGFCTGLLRAESLAAGIEPGFAILDEGASGRLRDTAFSEALRGLVAEAGLECVDVLAAYGVDRLGAVVQAAYQQLRSRGAQHPRLPIPDARHSSPSTPSAQSAHGHEAADPRAIAVLAVIDDLLRRFGEAYAQAKRVRGALDFDDLELEALRVLREREDLREEWASRFEMIMVDEFQDTNPLQLELLALLERDNVFTVGDEWQSIYGFRHAEVEIFRQRSAALQARGAALALTGNFRSCAPVIEVVNRVFAGRFGVRYTRLRAARGDLSVAGEDLSVGEARHATAGGDLSAADGGLSAAREELPGAGESVRVAGEDGAGARAAVELLLTDCMGWEEDPELAREIARGLPDATLWRQAEARALARRVSELVDSGEAAPGEIAVLLRATGDIALYERALRYAGLPTAAVAGGFWRSPEIGDLLAYLRVVANPLDEIALYGLLASPMVGLSADSLALLARGLGHGRLWGRMRSGGLELLEGEDRARAALLQGHIQEARHTAPERPIASLLRGALTLAPDSGGLVGPTANVRKLLAIAADFERAEGRDLRGFLDHVAHLAAAGGGSEPDAPSAGSELGAVALMTIHAAKGLEFPVVCIADLGRKQNGGALPYLLLDGDRVGLRLLTLNAQDPKSALEYDQLLEERRSRESQEEDRILYVAMTRARDRLLISGATKLRDWPKPSRTSPPIAWLAPSLLPGLPDLIAGLEGQPGSLHFPGEEVLCLLNTPSSGAALGYRQPGAGLPPVLGTSLNGQPGAGLPPVLGTSLNGQPGAGLPPVLGASSSEAAGGGQAYSPHWVAPPVAPPQRKESLQGVLDGGALSYTAIAQLERCGYRYYLERVLGMPEGSAAGRSRRGRGPSARMRGEVAHRMLERVDFAGAPPGVYEVETAAREIGVQLGRRDSAEVAALVGALAATPLGVRIAAASRVSRERPFAFTVERPPGEAAPSPGYVPPAPGQARPSPAEALPPAQAHRSPAEVLSAAQAHRSSAEVLPLAQAPLPLAQAPMITGAFDLVAVERGGGWMIVDYKTGTVGEEDDLQAIAEREFAVQRLVYGLAALCDGAPEVEVVHWFVHRPYEPVAVRFSAAQRPGLESSLSARIRRLAERGFAVSEHPGRRLCATCPGRGSLCSWDERETNAG